MLPITTSKEMLLADRATIAAGTPSCVLMERAATAVLHALLDNFDTSGKILLLCGAGNNGADGLVLARLLCERGLCAEVIFTGKQRNGRPDRGAMGAEAAARLDELPPKVRILEKADFAGVSAIVDALFGVGLSRDITDGVADLIRAVNGSGIPVLSIDLPSGIHADTGRIMGVAIRARQTVAISNIKQGHLLHPGVEYTGKLTVANIGIPLLREDRFLLEKNDLAALPARPTYANKGTFGRVLIIGGAVGMSGAGFFAAKSAYRAGAGLVELLTPARNRTIYQRQLPEAVLSLYPENRPNEQQLTAALCRARAVAIGMGLSQNEAARMLLLWTLSHTPGDTPLLIDADGLNLLANEPQALARLKQRTTKAILTPHLGEMARLCKKHMGEITGDLVKTAREFARDHGVILVMKDTRTVITDGEYCYINPFGNNGMATGGSGDALAGTIAAFSAFSHDALQSAYLGVLTHALAGDLAAAKRGKRGLMAGDLPDAIGEILKDVP